MMNVKKWEEDLYKRNKLRRRGLKLVIGKTLRVYLINISKMLTSYCMRISRHPGPTLRH